MGTTWQGSLSYILEDGNFITHKYKKNWIGALLWTYKVQNKY